MYEAGNLDKEVKIALHTNNENSTKKDIVINNNTECFDSSEPELATLTISPSYLPWNDFFISLCYLTAARSKDPRTKVGSCIIDKDNRVISLGYNGMPRGISDEDLPWEREATHSYDTKYPYVCHAEMNAILNEKHCALDGCSIYTTKFPCSECAKLIIQAGIKEVVYAESKPEPWEEQLPSRKMFSLAGIICRKFIPTVHHLNLNVIDGIGSVSIL